MGLDFPIPEILAYSTIGRALQASLIIKVNDMPKLYRSPYFTVHCSSELPYPHGSLLF